MTKSIEGTTQGIKPLSEAGLYNYAKWNEMRKNPPKPDPATEAYCKAVIEHWKRTSEIVKDLWKI
jgi:hypothetical protein